jgi:hypothetical protein
LINYRDYSCKLSQEKKFAYTSSTPLFYELSENGTFKKFSRRCRAAEVDKFFGCLTQLNPMTNRSHAATDLLDEGGFNHENSMQGDCFLCEPGACVGKGKRCGRPLS